MTLIHVDPDALEALAWDLIHGARALEDTLYELRHALGRLEVSWMGDDAVIFSLEYRRALNNLVLAVQTLDELAARLRRHAIQWREYEELWAARYRALVER